MTPSISLTQRERTEKHPAGGRGSSADVIVIGTGGVGSAAMFHLASRGIKVLGIDQFPPVHALGSSHGQSRMIRKAYFEHPDYVPLLCRAYQLWDELAAESGRPDLFHRTGLVMLGPPDGNIIRGVLESAAEHQLAVDPLSTSDMAERFPQFRIPDGFVCLLENDAGLLRVEDCVRTHLDLAVAKGAELRTGITVLGWKSTSAGVDVMTDQGVFAASALIVTAGPWAPGLLADLGVPMKVRRKTLFWLRARTEAHRMSGGCPCFFYDTPEGQFYGFPEMEDHAGVKVACHTGGETVPDPASVNRELDTADLAQVRSFASRWLPKCGQELLQHASCLYTMSPDEHFIVDRHPSDPRIVFAAGLSGHGFKFASVLGEAMADLASSGQTTLPMDFLGLSRFSTGTR